MIKIIKYFFQATLIYIYFIFIKLIGLKLARIFSSFLFNKIGPVIKSKDIIDENLDRFMGSYNDSKKESIKTEMWSNYGKTFVEYLFLKRFRKNNSHIKIKGTEILQKIIKKNKPVIFVSGHFANFELMSMELTKRNIKLATIYRPLNNFFINPFMEHVRRTYVCKNQIKKGLAGVKSAINYIHNNFSIALMIDQRVSEGRRLPFFGDMALTTTLPAQLATKYHLDIVPIYIARNKNNDFEMIIYEPIQTSDKKDRETSKLDLTIRLNKIAEQMIAKDPGQWIWTHNRWK
jgi:KDO2-lipid IV(A) lauroyltransferase|tara:strand:+ start:4839 stop:5708 length:870 start_codon:yes stop_codon:yes gene_type:complete